MTTPHNIDQVDFSSLDIDKVARQIAREIRGRRNSLHAEETGLPSHRRALKWREQDHARINGMLIALSIVVGRPQDVLAAEEFVNLTAPGSRKDQPSD